MISDRFFIYFDEMEIYRSIYTQTKGKKFMSLRDVFYKIDTPFMMESHVANWLDEKEGKCRKRKHKTCNSKVPEFIEKNSAIVQSVHQKFLTVYCEKLLNGNSEFLDVGNKEARNLVKNAPKLEFEVATTSSFCKEIFIADLEKTRDTSFITKTPTLYRNKHSECILANSLFQIPPHSSFLLGDVSAINYLTKKNGMNYFDFIIIDPPWRNRTVKRQKSYELISNVSSSDRSSFYSNKLSVDTIQRLPISMVLMPNGLLCLWVTNSQTVFQSAYNLLEHWGLKLIAQWHWLKICKSGEPVCAFRPFHKVPFETLLLACRPEAVDKYKSIQDDFCIISVPNAFPSRKPPISILLEKLGYVSPVKNGLELFARYLLPKFTSIGHETIKFQHVYYFSEL